jgi:hypothetical protein
MAAFCQSCTYPLDAPNAMSADPRYCSMCADETGKLKPREVVQASIAGWLKSWQGEISDATATVRAARFMSAMPAWAED